MYAREEMQPETGLHSLNSRDVFASLIKIREEYTAEWLKEPSTEQGKRARSEALELLGHIETKVNDTSITRRDMRYDIKSLLSGVSEDGLKEYNHLALVTGLLEQLSFVIADSNAKDTEDSYDFQQTTDLLVKAGWDDSDFGQFYSKLAIWPTLTAHPNQDLSTEGTNLACGLLEAAEHPDPQQRTHHVAQYVAEILRCQDLAPKRRATMREEWLLGRQHARTFRKGQQAAFSIQNAALKHSLNDSAFDLNDRTRFQMDVRLSDWHNDADGKPNAELLAMIGYVCGFTQGAYESHMDSIDDTLAGFDEGSYEQEQEDLRRVRSVLGILNDRIETILERAIALEGQHWTERGEEELKLAQDLISMYEGISIPGADGSEILPSGGENGPRSGLNTYYWLCESFDKVRQSLPPRIRPVIDETLHLLYNYGLTMAKSEPRNGGPVEEEVMTKLFAYEPFQDIARHIDGLTTSERFVLRNEGAYSQTLDKQSKADLLLKVAHHYEMDKQKPEAERVWKKPLSMLLIEANAPQDDETDDIYPPQRWEFVRKMDLMRGFRHKFGVNVISDAKQASSIEQQFIFDAFGLKGAMHTALNEDLDTIEQSHNFVRMYYRRAGERNIRDREKTSLLKASSHTDQITMMQPLSDSQKKGGPFQRWILRRQRERINRVSNEEGITIHTKIGTGLSIPRNLRDIMNVVRHAAGLENDSKVLGNHTFLSPTIQGRARTFLIGTPKRAQRYLTRTIAEMMGLEAERQGILPQGTFIPKRFTKDGQMALKLRYLMDHYAEQQVDRYNAFREAYILTDDSVPIAGADQVTQRYSNEWARAVTTPDKVRFSNQGARAQSKEKGNKSKEMTDERAIGSVNFHRHAMTFHDGYFTLGHMMRNLYGAYTTGELSKDDLVEIVSDPFFKQELIAMGMMSLVGADFEHGFEKIRTYMESRRPTQNVWSPDAALAYGENVMIGRGPDGEAMIHLPENASEIHEGLTDIINPSEAYQAIVFHDAVDFAALSNALLELCSHAEHGNDIETASGLLIDTSIEAMRAKVLCKTGETNIDFSETVIFDHFYGLEDTYNSAKRSLPSALMLSEMKQREDAQQTVFSEEDNRLAASAWRVTTTPYLGMLLAGDPDTSRKPHQDQNVTLKQHL